MLDVLPGRSEAKTGERSMFDVSFKNPPGRTSLRFHPSPGFQLRSVWRGSDGQVGGQAEASAFSRIAGFVETSRRGRDRRSAAFACFACFAVSNHIFPLRPDGVGLLTSQCNVGAVRQSHRATRLCLLGRGKPARHYNSKRLASTLAPPKPNAIHFPFAFLAAWRFNVRT